MAGVQIIEVPGIGEVEFPADMPDDQIAAAIKKSTQPQAAPVTAGERVNAAAGGTNRGLAGILGLPVDFAQNLANLGIAGYGVVRGAITGDPGASPEPISGAFGGSDWIAKRLESIGFNTQNPRPDDAVSRMLYTGGQVVGSSVVPGARLAPTGVSAGSAALASELLGPEWAAPASMAPAAMSAVRNARAESLQRQQAQNAVRDATAADSRAQGYVIPPTQSNPSILNKALEGFAGKITTAQLASTKNQDVTNRLARRSIGLADDAPLTANSLENVRAEAGKAYEAVKSFGAQNNIQFKPDQEFIRQIGEIGGDFSIAAKKFPGIANNSRIAELKAELSSGPISPVEAIEAAKKLRSDAKINFRAFDKPEQLALARAQRQAADALEGLVERGIARTGQPQLMREFRAARTMIARAHDIEAALNETTGNVSTRTLSAMGDKGKPLGGGLEKAANFGNAFPKAAQNPETIGSQPGLSPLDYALGFLTGGATGNPMLAAAALSRPVVRSVIMSRPYQALTGTPSYSPMLPALAEEGAAVTLARPSVLLNK